MHWFEVFSFAIFSEFDFWNSLFCLCCMLGWSSATLHHRLSSASGQRVRGNGIVPILQCHIFACICSVEWSPEYLGEIHTILDQKAIRSLSLAAFLFTTKSFSGSSRKHSFPPGSKAILSGKIYPATWLGDRIQMGLFLMTCWCQPQIWIILSLSYFNLRLPKILRNLGLIKHLIALQSINSVRKFWFSFLG